jgi:hypothetical protein
MQCAFAVIGAEYGVAHLRRGLPVLRPVVVSAPYPVGVAIHTCGNISALRWTVSLMGSSCAVRGPTATS